MTTIEAIAAIERCAFEAWNADRVLEVAGLRLRSHHGVTRRANSVWPNDYDGSLALDLSIARAERFYAERGQPARFYVSPVGPADLDRHLAERGYTIDAPIQVLTATVNELRELRALREGPELRTQLSDDYEGDWLALSADRGRFAEARDHYRAILDRVRGRAVFATSYDRARPIAVGLGVLESGPVPRRLGLFSMLTLPEARRRGAATALLRAIVGWAQSHGAEQAYLQVESDNASALALYRRCGFITAYRAHYRLQPEEHGQ